MCINRVKSQVVVKAKGGQLVESAGKTDFMGEGLTELGGVGHASWGDAVVL